MITKINAYQSGDGTAHSSLEEAQRHEIRILLKDEVKNDPSAFYEVIIVKNRERIMDILSTTATSKVRARKVNGAVRKRKPTAPAMFTEPPKGDAA